MGTRRAFHLLRDFIFDAAGATGSERPRGGPLPVPDGVSCLGADDTGEWHLRTVPKNRLDGGQFLLEPVWHGQHPQLLLICPAGERVRVNGRPAPQWCLLSERDQVQLDEDHVLHVTIYNSADLGPPSAERVGSECPVCRTTIEADTRVYSCHHCGTAIHLEGEKTPLVTRLECALAVSACPVCQQKIEMTAGYTWQPELYCE